MSDVEVEMEKWMRMELLVLLLLLLLVLVVIYHVREAELHDECPLELKRVDAVWSLVLVEDHVIVIDREVQV